jgi:hypothetical protein
MCCARWVGYLPLEDIGQVGFTSLISDNQLPYFVLIPQCYWISCFHERVLGFPGSLRRDNDRGCRSVLKCRMMPFKCVPQYWLVHKGRVDVPAMYNPRGRYRYHFGIVRDSSTRSLVQQFTIPE